MSPFRMTRHRLARTPITSHKFHTQHNKNKLSLHPIRRYRKQIVWSKSDEPFRNVTKDYRRQRKVNCRYKEQINLYIHLQAID